MIFIFVRVIRIFLRNTNGKRPVNGGDALLDSDPYWKDYIYLYEYFHCENGRGVGASHQTGWTGLVSKVSCEKIPRLFNYFFFFLFFGDLNRWSLPLVICINLIL